MADLSKKAVVLAFTALCCLNLIAAIDATALSVSIPTIATSLNATGVQAYWAGTSFVLASSVVQPVFAAFSCAFGRKAMVVLALTLFIIGTFVCGSAQSIATLVVGRSIQGVGGGGLLTMTYVVMSDLLSLRNRAKGLAVNSLVWLLGTVVGPVLGGGLTANVSWRWVFWVCLPLLGISLVLVVSFLRTSHKSLPITAAFGSVDWVGAVLFVASLTASFIGLSWGGSTYSWTSWHTLTPLIMGVMGLLAWVIYGRFAVFPPILPLSILNNRTAVTTYSGTLVLGIIQFARFYYLPFYYQVSKGYSPLISGLGLLPSCLISGPTTAILGFVISRTGRYRLVIWLGWTTLSLGCGLHVLLTTNSSVAEWVLISAVTGLGLGALFDSQSIASQAATTNEHEALAAGLTPFFRGIGQALGIVIGDSVFQNSFKGHLLRAPAVFSHEQAANFARDAASLARLAQAMPKGSVEREQLLTAFDGSIHAIWWTITALALASGLLSLMIREINLDRPTSVSLDGLAEDIENGRSHSEELTVIPTNVHRQELVIECPGIARHCTSLTVRC